VCTSEEKKNQKKQRPLTKEEEAKVIYKKLQYKRIA